MCSNNIIYSTLAYRKKHKQKKARPYLFLDLLILMSLGALDFRDLPAEYQFTCYESGALDRYIKLYTRLKRAEFLLETLSSDTSIVMISLASAGKYAKFANLFHTALGVSQNEMVIKAGAHFGCHFGTSFCSALMLFQTFSMLSDCIDNLQQLRNLKITFQNTNFLETSQYQLLCLINLISITSVFADTGLELYSILTPYTIFLNTIPILTLVNHVLSISIDAIQTYLFSKKLLIIETEIVRQLMIIDQIQNNLNKNIDSTQSLKIDLHVMRRFIFSSKTEESKEEKKKINTSNPETLKKIAGEYGIICQDFLNEARVSSEKQIINFLLRTTGKLILIGVTLVALSVNPALGAILLIGSLLIKKLLQRDATISSHDEHGLNFQTKYFSQLPNCFHNTLDKRRNQAAHLSMDNDEAFPQSPSASLLSSVSNE